MFSSLAILALASASMVSAHMEMTWPYPFRSKWNPAISRASSEIDWSMTNPLGAYPCKGYIDTTTPSVTTWSAGSTINYTIAGTAIHGGGSCQISMSYDHGSTWNVIYSIIGGCVIESLTENVKIPSDAPSGEALFSWSWFNLIGNREMYQNCAPVTVIDGGNGLNSADYPAPFVANVDVAPGCKTIEGTEVVFPNPGKNVKYGGKYAGTIPKAGLGITGDCGTVSSTTSNTDASTSAESQASSSTSSVVPTSSSVVVPVPSVSAVSAISSGNQNDAAAAPSSSSSSSTSAAASTTSTSTSPKKCKRRNTTRGIEKRHERLTRHSAHQHLVRRRLSNHH